MNKQELIKLVNELLNTSDLSKRSEDLIFLKREYKYFSNKEEETFYDKKLTEEFISAYEQLALKEPKLTQSVYDEKKEIISLTKQLLDREDVLKATKEFDKLQDSFKKAGRCSKEQDDELWAEFKSLKEQLFAKRKAFLEELEKTKLERKAKKEEVIKKAQELLVIKNNKEATEKMDALMEEWKAIGFAGKAYDEELWHSFSSVRKEFQQKKKEHHEEMVKLFEERANKKEELILTAKKLLADSDFSPEEVKRVKDLRNEFNKIGFAGKEKDDELYERFSEVIKKYFDDKKFYTF